MQTTKNNIIAMYCSENRSVLSGVLSASVGFFLSLLKMQIRTMGMETRNFGEAFARPSLRKTQKTFLKILWM